MINRVIVAVFLSMLFLVSCHKDEPCATCPSDAGDTTSHNFAWVQYTLGGAASSALYDVAILNDTCAVAVGEIFISDSSGGVDPFPYSIALWNGKNWRLKKVYDTDSQVISNIRGVFAFSPTDIWIADGGVHHWDGTSPQTDASFGRISLIGGVENGQSINRLWGTNSRDLYGVGWRGLVTHYNGNNWQKISSGTTLDIRDIWGATIDNPFTQTAAATQILAVASGNSPAEGKKLLYINGTTVTEVPDSGLSWSLYGIWFVPGQKYYVVGAGIGQKSVLDASPWSVYPSGVVTSYLSGCVRGNGVNDVFVVGSFLECVHFNGDSWHNYRDQIPFADGALGRVAVKGNLAIAVGSIGQQAVAIVGRRRG